MQSLDYCLSFKKINRILLSVLSQGFWNSPLEKMSKYISLDTDGAEVGKEEVEMVNVCAIIGGSVRITTLATLL